MKITKKKMKVILSTVLLYIILEEYAVIMQTSKKFTSRVLEQGNLWSISGRQTIMQMRDFVNFKVNVR